MSIWKVKCTVDELNQGREKNIHGALGIQFLKIGEDYLEASLPVDHRTHQPFGLLHGGASVVLAESLGSVASLLFAGEGNRGVGVEINASHLKSVQAGQVIGRVTPIRLGKTLHVWEIRIRESMELTSPLICICRLSVFIKKHHPGSVGRVV